LPEILTYTKLFKMVVNIFYAVGVNILLVLMLVSEAVLYKFLLSYSVADMFKMAEYAMDTSGV